LGDSPTKYSRFSLEYFGVEFVAHSILSYTSTIKNDTIRVQSLEQYYNQYLLTRTPHSILSILYKQKSSCGGASANTAAAANGNVTAPCAQSLNNSNCGNNLPSYISTALILLLEVIDLQSYRKSFHEKHRESEKLHYYLSDIKTYHDTSSIRDLLVYLQEHVSNIDYYKQSDSSVRFSSFELTLSSSAHHHRHHTRHHHHHHHHYHHNLSI
jgi:hypothetical protein